MVGGGVTNSWVGGVVEQTSGGRAVGGGVPYSGEGGVVLGGVVLGGVGHIQPDHIVFS